MVIICIRSEVFTICGGGEKGRDEEGEMVMSQPRATA